MRLIPAIALALTLLPAGAAETRSVWRVSTYTWIKRVRAEPGAPANGQPVRVQPTALVRILGAVELGLDGEPLFTKEELVRLAKPLAEALALATPGEDLEVLSTWKHGTQVFSSATGVTARVFARDGKLNLIVHDARLDFIAENVATDNLPVFQFGSRAAAGGVVLSGPGVALPRPDWAQLTLEAPPAVIAPPTLPAASVPPPPPPVASAPPQPPPPPPGLLDRLRLLKQSREEDLITEAEYVQRKQEILQQF
jgi:hypothetical protein